MRLYARCRSGSGAAALEGMVSILLLFGFFYCTWGVALVMYNQTKLNTATQMAAYSVSTLFERRTWGNEGDTTTNGQPHYAGDDAKIAAKLIINESLRQMANDQFVSTVPTLTAGSPDIKVTCGSWNEFIAGTDNTNCLTKPTGIGPTSPSIYETITIKVQATLTGDVWLLAPLSHGWRRKLDDRRNVTYNSRAFGYSLGAASSD